MHRVRQQLLLPDSAALGAGVRVAVLDTGIDAAHPDLAKRIDLRSSKNFSLVDDLSDRNGHGTHVAGIIAGTGAASSGVYRGIAPQASLTVYKVTSGSRGAESSAAAAVAAAIDAGVDIINFSHGYAPRVQPPPWIWPGMTNVLEDALIAADSRGILCVVAAGNAGPYAGSITRPGGLSCVLTVGAEGQDGRVMPLSGRGPFRRSMSVRPGQVVRFDPDAYRDVVATPKPDVVLPGEQITSLRSGHAAREDEGEGERDPLYAVMNGSSQATAVATGLAAALLSLAKKHKIDLGANRAHTLYRLIRSSASQLSIGDPADFGAGTVKWPMLQTTLSDFSKDPQFRASVLNPELRLL